MARSSSAPVPKQRVAIASSYTAPEVVVAPDTKLSLWVSSICTRHVVIKLRKGCSLAE
jgi:hypothetical protein